MALVGVEGSPYDRLFKIVFVGDEQVGKSSFLTAAANGLFSDAYISTIGIDFVSGAEDAAPRADVIGAWCPCFPVT